MSLIGIFSSMKNFDEAFSGLFPYTSFESLVTSPLPRVRLKMGSLSEPAERRAEVVERSLHVLSFLFDGSAMWGRIRLWDGDTDRALEKLGQYECAESAVVQLRAGSDDACILLRHWKEFDAKAVVAILHAIAGYELGLEPRIDLKCYFISLSRGFIVNLYDDRGMDVVAVSPNVVRHVADEFPDLVIDIRLPAFD
jgi:hypothetical protein